jgi:hypothetical protein
MRLKRFAAAGTPDAMRDRAASNVPCWARWLPYGKAVSGNVLRLTFRRQFSFGRQRGQMPRKAEPKVIVAMQYAGYKAEAWSNGS